MKEALYANSKSCEPKNLSPQAIRQYYWEQGFLSAKISITEITKSLQTNTKKCPNCKSIYIWHSANGLGAKCDDCGHSWNRRK